MNEHPDKLPEVMPIFPLPEVVLFPRAVLPLHMFEPRYRTMTADALAGDGLIAVALLRPGFEPLYYTQHAPIHRVLGVGRIVASEEVDEGNYNILLRGEIRGRVVEEFEDRPYRCARVEPLTTSCNEPQTALRQLRKDLRRALRNSPLVEPTIRAHWLTLLRTPLKLGDVTDLIASGLPVDGEVKQCFLAEIDAPARAGMLLSEIQALTAVVQQRRQLGGGEPWRMN